MCVTMNKVSPRLTIVSHSGNIIVQAEQFVMKKQQKCAYIQGDHVERQ